MKNAAFMNLPCPKCGQPARVVNPAWLRKQRKDANWTQAKVASALGFSVPYISDIERGARACPVTVREFYEAL